MTDHNWPIDSEERESSRKQGCLRRRSPGMAARTFAVAKTWAVERNRATYRARRSASRSGAGGQRRALERDVWSNTRLISISSNMTPFPCRNTTGGPLPCSTQCSLTPSETTNEPSGGLERSAAADRRLTTDDEGCPCQGQRAGSQKPTATFCLLG